MEGLATLSNDTLQVGECQVRLLQQWQDVSPDVAWSLCLDYLVDQASQHHVTGKAKFNREILFLQSGRVSRPSLFGLRGPHPWCAGLHTQNDEYDGENGSSNLPTPWTL